MDLSQCKHFRLRHIVSTSINVELLIKSLEKQYKIDIRSISQWKELINRLYAEQNDLKSKINDALERKKRIIEKIYTQNYRDSPFELTGKLARTATVWKEIEFNNKKKHTVKIDNTPESIISLNRTETNEEIDEATDIKSTAHPNTEELEHKEQLKENLSDTDRETQGNSEASIKLPAYICTNPHKYLSPLTLQSPIAQSKKTSSTTFQEHEDEISLKQTNIIRCYPEEVILKFNSDQLLKEQCIKFKLTNCTNEWADIRFKGLSGSQLLRRIKINPSTPVKLYAGLSKVYLLRFKLKSSVKYERLNINFKIGHGLDNPDERLRIPLHCEFSENRLVYVSDCVYLTPIYEWQLTNSQPSASIIIRVEDDYFYHVHVRRRDINWTQSYDVSNSLQVQALTTESEMEREFEFHSRNTLNQSNLMELIEESITTVDIINDIFLEMVETALKSFILQPSYVYLAPHSVHRIEAVFKKAEYIGPHQCCYDLEFFNPFDNNLVLTKTVKVFAEVLPHPIQIRPHFLDMSETPIISGLCVDTFTIYNMHNFIPVTIKIKLSTKMNRIFHISPQETFITAKSNASFDVSLCPKSATEQSDDFVHFTIKIIVVGDKSIYTDAPPFFYEIIIPCAQEFKKIYGKKYFDSTKGSLESDDRTETITEVENRLTNYGSCELAVPMKINKCDKEPVPINTIRNDIKNNIMTIKRMPLRTARIKPVNTTDFKVLRFGQVDCRCPHNTETGSNYNRLQIILPYNCAITFMAWHLLTLSDGT